MSSIAVRWYAARTEICKTDDNFDLEPLPPIGPTDVALMDRGGSVVLGGFVNADDIYKNPTCFIERLAVSWNYNELFFQS